MTFWEINTDYTLCLHWLILPWECGKCYSFMITGGKYIASKHPQGLLTLTVKHPICFYDKRYTNKQVPCSPLLTTWLFLIPDSREFSSEDTVLLAHMPGRKHYISNEILKSACVGKQKAAVGRWRARLKVGMKTQGVGAAGKSGKVAPPGWWENQKASRSLINPERRAVKIPSLCQIPHSPAAHGIKDIVHAD